MKAAIVALIATLAIPAFADYWEPIADPVDRLQEYRFCGAPLRNADGTIKRSSTVLTAFKKLHPCPVTGKSSGACPGWAINHIVPLANGGCDAVVNLMWLPAEVKSCADDWCVDRWERTYWQRPHGVIQPFGRQAGGG